MRPDNHHNALLLCLAYVGECALLDEWMDITNVFDLLSRDSTSHHPHSTQIESLANTARQLCKLEAGGINMLLHL